MKELVAVQPFPGRSIDDWLTDYRLALMGKDASTIDAYLRVIRQFARWFACRPGNDGQF